MLLGLLLGGVRSTQVELLLLLMLTRAQGEAGEAWQAPVEGVTHGAGLTRGVVRVILLLHMLAVAPGIIGIDVVIIIIIPSITLHQATTRGGCQATRVKTEGPGL